MQYLFSAKQAQQNLSRVRVAFHIFSGPPELPTRQSYRSVTADQPRIGADNLLIANAATRSTAVQSIERSPLIHAVTSTSFIAHSRTSLECPGLDSNQLDTSPLEDRDKM